MNSDKATEQLNNISSKEDNNSDSTIKSVFLI